MSVVGEPRVRRHSCPVRIARNAITFTGGANILTLQTGWSLNGAIALQTAGTSVTFNQSIAVNVTNVITGLGSVIQNGTGTLTLTGANTYTGNTNITQGTLALTGTGSIASSDSLSVGNSTANAIFDISGTTSGTSIAALAGATDGTVDSEAKR